MKRIVALLLLVSTQAHAGIESAIVAVISLAPLFEEKPVERPPEVVAYPVPVFQPQVIVVPQCTANYACPTPILQCDTLPVVDQWGRIISYQKTCR